MRFVILVWILLAAPVRADQFLGFQSPSGNIMCLMIEGPDGGVRCDMAALTPSFTKAPTGCDFDWGSSFWIGPRDRQGTLACVSDSVMDPSAQVLPYGAQLSFGGVTCGSERTGVTCTNPAGHGFALARAHQQMF